MQKKPSLQNASNRMPQRGDLSKSSIFEQDEAARRRKEQEAKLDAELAGRGSGGVDASTTPGGRNLSAMAAALDPQPVKRLHWEARMVAREVRRRGRMSRTEVLRQTERQHTDTSPLLKTSVKKLGMLARQIAGKTLDEAMVQMRFSSKKTAKDVLSHLEYARDAAVVRRGMGLGAAAEEGETHDPVMIRDKEGNRVKVTDPTSMYIDEAWVNRGKYGKKPEYRARGRVNVLHLPYTSLTVVLKEEATRIRKDKEREEKEAKRKPWIAMPNRPITAQHQYPLW